MNLKKLAIVSLAVAGGLAAASAQARDRDDVRWSVTVGSPVWSVYATPAYGPAFVARPYDRRYDERSYRPSTNRWDRDRDGIPNRYDRLYNPPWDRDGDGIPNRYDRRDDRRHRR